MRTDEVTAPIDPKLEARRRKCFVLADEIGLTRDERHAFAELVLRRDVTTWGDLSDSSMGRLLDGLEGFLLVSALLSQRV